MDDDEWSRRYRDLIRRAKERQLVTRDQGPAGVQQPPSPRARVTAPRPDVAQRRFDTAIDLPPRTPAAVPVKRNVVARRSLPRTYSTADPVAHARTKPAPQLRPIPKAAGKPVTNITAKRTPPSQVEAAKAPLTRTTSLPAIPRRSRSMTAQELEVILERGLRRRHSQDLLPRTRPALQCLDTWESQLLASDFAVAGDDDACQVPTLFEGRAPEPRAVPADGPRAPGRRRLDANDKARLSARRRVLHRVRSQRLATMIS